MKNIKFIFGFLCFLALAFSCTMDGIDDDISFINSADAPANIVAFYNITQDNSGLVTITPNGEGAVSYEVFYGDDTATPALIAEGKSTSHIYKEGTYTVKIVGTSISGTKTEVTQPLVVSFKAPENLEVEISNDLAVSKKVNVKLKAKYATMFDVYFGEEGNSAPVSANIDQTASYVYAKPGNYTIRVVAKSAAIQTTEKSTSFVVTAISQPIASAPNPPSRQAANVISIYGSAYTNVAGTNYFPDWGQGGQGSSWSEFNLNGDKMLNYIKLSYQGISIGETIDVSGMEFIHLDVWTADASKIETSLINGVDGNSTEKPFTSNLAKDQWTSIDIPISAFTNQGLSVNKIFQLKFVGTPWAAGTVFIDNIYFYKAATPSSGLEGTWKLAPEAGSLKVGPSSGSGAWWSIDAAGVTQRACFYDDTYVFSANGSFSNGLGTETWLEKWQGVAADGCGAPVAPHNGASGATYLYDAVAKTLTVTGKGAYIGLAKVNNTGELDKLPTVPNSIVYKVNLTDNNNTMNVEIEAGGGVFWSYKLVRI